MSMSSLIVDISTAKPSRSALTKAWKDGLQIAVQTQTTTTAVQIVDELDGSEAPMRTTRTPARPDLQSRLEKMRRERKERKEAAQRAAESGDIRIDMGRGRRGSETSFDDEKIEMDDVEAWEPVRPPSSLVSLSLPHASLLSSICQPFQMLIFHQCPGRRPPPSRLACRRRRPLRPVRRRGREALNVQPRPHPPPYHFTRYLSRLLRLYLAGTPLAFDSFYAVTFPSGASSSLAHRRPPYRSLSLGSPVQVNGW